MLFSFKSEPALLEKFVLYFFFMLLANFKIAYIDKDTIIITDITHITNNPNIYTSHNKITNNKVQ